MASAVLLNNDRVVIRGVHCNAWRFGDAFHRKPGLALRIQAYGFGDPFAAPALGLFISE